MLTEFDELDRETSNTASFALPGATFDLSRTVTWNQAKNLPSTSTLKIGAGSWATDYTYDLGDKLTGILGGVWGTGGVSVNYNTTGTTNKLSDTVTLPWGGATTRTFAYTTAGRLETAQIGSRSIGYTWDPEGTGTLNSMIDSGVTTTFTYEASRLASMSRGGVVTTFGFDDAGRRILEQSPSGNTEMTWTGDDHLRTWTRKDAGGSVVASATHTYDADGQRIKAAVRAPNPWSTTATDTVYSYGWDGLQLRWIRAESGDTSATISYLFDEADRPYAAAYAAERGGQTESAVFALMTTDHGDVVGLADEAGEQFARYAYGPFGEAEETASRSTGALSSTLAAQITAFNPLRYASYDFDTWASTYYLQARHYDPATKQFLSKDPAEADGEESAYQYCAGDPVNQDDPDGEFAQVLWGAAGGAAWYAGERFVASAWKSRSVFKKRGFKAGMRSTWKNVKKSWSWKSFGTEVAIGAATGGLGALAKSGKLAKYGAKAASGARAGRCRVLTRGSSIANKLSRGSIPAKAFCFVAGTLVVTATGAVPIQAIQPGDLVLAREAASGEQAYKPVTETYLNTTTELIHVTVGGETITATPSHPFWADGIGWTDAKDLSAGMPLSLADGTVADIVSVTRERLASPVAVYNFQVADYHTYFVASAGVWVHNDCEFGHQLRKYGQGGIRISRKGRVQLLGKIKPATSSGPTAGRRMVRELKRGAGKRTWFEDVDHAGNITQIRTLRRGKKVHIRFKNGRFDGKW